MTKKFNLATFHEKLLIDTDRVFRAIDNLENDDEHLVKQKPPNEIKFNELMCISVADFKKLNHDQRRKYIKDILACKPLGWNQFRPVHEALIARINKLWELTKLAANNIYEEVDGKIYIPKKGFAESQLWENAIELLELTNGSLLIIPEVSTIVMYWKIHNKTKYLKRLSVVIAPGNKGKGVGGSKKKWKNPIECECFARMHDLIVERGFSVSSAAVNVARFMSAKSPKVLERKYRKQLSYYQKYFDLSEINEAISNSLK